MAFLDTLPVWALALMIFFLRIVDVSMGTVRMVAVVNGMTRLAVGLGFFEILVWVMAVSQVIARIGESPILILAYAGGYATGNALGILIEGRMAFGMVVLRIFTAKAGEQIAKVLRNKGQVLTTFDGEGRDGPVTLLFVTCPRRKQNELLALARKEDPNLFFTVERANAWRHRHGSVKNWHLLSKRK